MPEAYEFVDWTATEMGLVATNAWLWTMGSVLCGFGSHTC